MPQVRVTYLELLDPPRPPARLRETDARIAVERLALEPYLDLYRRVGGPMNWGARLRLDRRVLAALLASDRLHIHLARAPDGTPLGLCEFDRTDFPVVELKNFGLVPEAQGRGLGPRLLDVGLQGEWGRGATRIWLHTDTQDHPAAMGMYERAGFRAYQVREESSDDL